MLSSRLTPEIETGDELNPVSSDVLPWQCLTRYPEACKNAVFVDVDFPDLMLKKREIVLGTQELASPLGHLQSPQDGPILLRSDKYFQIGCDLRDTEALQQALSSVADLGHARLFFVAEVSITYMETTAADSLIKWASTVGQGKSISFLSYSRLGDLSTVTGTPNAYSSI